jgi:hypothetical protein
MLELTPLLGFGLKADGILTRDMDIIVASHFLLPRVAKNIVRRWSAIARSTVGIKRQLQGPLVAQSHRFCGRKIENSIFHSEVLSLQSHQIFDLISWTSEHCFCHGSH